MKYVIALALALALAACNQQQAPSQSQATPGASSAESEGEPTINPHTSEGQAELRAMLTGYLDQVQQANLPEAQRDAGLQDQLSLITLGQSPVNWSVNLNAGVNYVFIGTCDNECSNLDIELVNGANAVVASDLLDDKIPIVSYTPAAAGAYTVRTHLRTCTVEPCQIGVRALTQ